MHTADDTKTNNDTKTNDTKTNDNNFPGDREADPDSTKHNAIADARNYNHVYDEGFYISANDKTSEHGNVPAHIDGVAENFNNLCDNLCDTDSAFGCCE